MELIQNDWVQHDIINKIRISNKRGSDMIHDINEYFSTTIIEHANVLAKVNKSPWENLHNITPHYAYIITINVHTVTLADISHEQKE